MPIPVTGSLVTILDLERVLQRSIKTIDRDAAQYALDMATEVVMAELNADPNTWTDADSWDVETVRAIVVRSAAQWFTNPEDRAVYSGPEGLSYTASQARMSRIISPDDREKLMLVKVKRTAGFG